MTRRPDRASSIDDCGGWVPVVMPMNLSTPIRIRRRQVVTITSPSFPYAWTVDRLYISASGTKGGASDWRLSSIRVDGHEKLSGPISGGVFAADAPQTWNDICWQVPAGQGVVMEVEYVGGQRDCPFYAAIAGYRFEKSMVKTAPAKSRFDAEAAADIVVRRGLATKNRFGLTSVPVPLPDGCYALTRLEPPTRREAKKLKKPAPRKTRGRRGQG